MPEYLPPLAIDGDHWRSRWLQFARGGAMHRVAIIAWDMPDEMIAGTGAAVCGRRGRLVMPGILSRMGAHRCEHCCAALGIPFGDGAPRNALTGEAADA